MTIEEKLISYLSGKTSAGASVYAERPVSISGKYLLIERTGSSRLDYIETFTVAVQSIVPKTFGSMADAMALNEEVKEALLGEDGTEKWGMISDSSVSSVGLNSDYNYTDTQTEEYRYQAIFLVTKY